MNRVQRIRRDLPGRRMEISSMDKQSFSFPSCFSRHPFSLFCFSPPPSLICCSRGLETHQILEIAVKLELGGERHLVPLWELAELHSSFVNLGFNTISLVLDQGAKWPVLPRQGMLLCKQNRR